MKHQYNQGDLLQFQRSRDRKPQLFVITDVFTNGRHERGNVNTYYKTIWIDKGEKEAYQINTLDDSTHVTLVARGQ